jgi:CO/xanthine dehydrogenase Mo-binding subunit
VGFARESLLDELAGRVGCDPLDFRLRNAWQAGVVNCTGQHLDAEHHSVTIRETLQSARAALDRAEEWREAGATSRHRRGVGVASGHQSVGGGVWTGADTAAALVKLNLDGSVTVTVGVADVGQGTSTALRQIVADLLRLPADAVALSLQKETDVVPFHGGASASRQLFTSGNAVRLAAESMQRELLRIAAELLEADPADLELEAGAVRVRGTAITRPFRELALFATNKLGEQPIVREAFRAPVRMLDAQLQGAPFQSFDYVTQVAEVDVDLDTGEVRLHRLVTVEDVGTAINPMIVEGQIDGCVAQGVGFALFEQIHVEHGHVLNPFLFDYRIPRMEDLPCFESVILEYPDPRGPLGAKAAGEAAIVPAAAAIANAVHDALGVRMTRLPLSSERIWRAMQDANGLRPESAQPLLSVRDR